MELINEKQRKRKPILQRLYQRVNIPVNDKGENDKTQCWIWHGVVNNAGYGMLKVDSEINMATAHRIVMIEEKKLINYGDKVEVLHSCGNRLCVNPDHLEIGDINDRIRLQIKYKNIIPCFMIKRSCGLYANIVANQIICRILKEDIHFAKEMPSINTLFNLYPEKNRCL